MCAGVGLSVFCRKLYVCVLGGGGVGNDICGNAYLTTEMEVGEGFVGVDFVEVGFWMKIREDTS